MLPAGDALIHAGLALLWLVTLHPFDDGNGRICCAVGEMVLSRAEGAAQRFYSLIAQIRRERQPYCDQWEVTQRGTLDVTRWLSWFLEPRRKATNARTSAALGSGSANKSTSN